MPAGVSSRAFAAPSRAAWLVNRLRLMSAPELLWRARRSLAQRAARAGVGLAFVPPRPDAAPAARAFVRMPLQGLAAADRAAILDAADALLAGRWNVFALRDAPLGFPPRWNRDPKTGRLAPLAFGPEIDYRDARVVGDIKYLWEPARHAELVTLAQAWALTRAPRYADGVRTLLESWFEQCPYPQGVHWTSALELALRLVNWSLAWQLLDGAAPFDAALRSRWLDGVYRHAHFVRHHLSAHSSANNHLFGEWLGLYVAGSTWPCWPALRRWREDARRGLEEQAQAQTSADGVHREQAIWYQHEVMDMMLVALVAARAHGEDFPASFRARLERMAEFVHALMDAGGRVPMLGDADDALIARLDPAPGFEPFRSLLASCALLFARGDFRHKAGALDAKTRWLLGADAPRAWDALAPRAAPPRAAFPEGGHFLLGSDFDTPREVRIAIDCAPLGYLSIAAHGHADALAFTLSAAGHELLVDPGTYAYHTERAWRDHFRGTLAHNTVCVDGCDQSRIGGPFMWLTKARARVLAHAPHGDLQRFAGEHDGYARLPDPVRHRREIAYDAPARRLTVTDRLDAHAGHDIEIAWHFHEDAQVSIDDDERVLVTRGPVSLRLWCDAGADAQVRLHRGSTDPLLGWVSRRFDERVPAAVAVWHARIDRPCTFVTHFALHLPCPA